MPCPELARLRQEIGVLQTRLKEETLAREKAEEVTGKREHDDLEVYLQRRIALAAEGIKEHIRRHNCLES